MIPRHELQSLLDPLLPAEIELAVIQPHSLSPVILALNVFVFALHIPVLRRVHHTNLLSLIQKQRSTLAHKPKRKHLRALLAPLGPVISKAAHRPAIVVILIEHRGPCIRALDERLPLLHDALHIWQRPGREVVLGCPARWALAEVRDVELEDHVEFLLPG